MKKFKLRDYQADDLKRINKEIKAGHKRVLYSLMTAGGKTVVLHEQVSRWLRKGLRGCVLVHTRALLNQTCAVFSDVPHGIIAGGIKSDPDKKLQICMVQSLARRGGKAFDFIVVDEAHHATASTWARILADSPEAIILGVTATPFRTDGRGLGQAGFTAIVEGPEVAWLTEQGFLSPVEYYAPTEVDMTGVKKVGGDYDNKEAGRRANRRTITGSAVEHYKRHASGQRALAFCANLKQVFAVTKQFKKAGLNAAFIYGKMSNKEREDILAQFATSEDMILVSCELIGEGLDVPAVACVILLRPTASLVRFIQQVGRGLRVMHWKKHVVVLDHVGNIRLGHPHVPREVDLNGVEKKAKALDDDSPKSYLRTCPKCKRVETADVLKCSTCGYKFGPASEASIFSKDGVLGRVDGFKYGAETITVCVCGRTGREKKRCILYIGKKYFSVGPDVRIADNIKAWIVDWLGKNKTLPCGQDLRNLVSEAIARCDPDFIKINKARTFRGGATHYCMANSTRIALGPDANLANAIRNYILDFYVDNKCEWPNGADIRRLARVAEFKLSPSFFPLQISGGRKSDRISISINGVNSGSLGRIGTANAARDYLLRFYESNNYEWPPKSEVPALVKKALEHAKSTLE